MKPLAEQGYVILAVDTEHVRYTDMAKRLCRSLRAWHPCAKVCLITDQDNGEHKDFDFVRTLPYGMLPGYQNDWQVWHASPFRETIKLEADMLVVSEVDHWWNLFRHRDVVVSQGARDFYDNSSDCRFYRKIFDENHLPDVYNAITYWRLSTAAQEFWRTVRLVFEQWHDIRTLIKFAPREADTDLVYAVAAQMLGPELVTLPPGVGPNLVHMKQHVIPTHSKDWTKELVWERLDRGLRIQTVQQWGFFHYHVKEWLRDEQ